jgi:hypothetical protein
MLGCVLSKFMKRCTVMGRPKGQFALLKRTQDGKGWICNHCGGAFAYCKSWWRSSPHATGACDPAGEQWAELQETRITRHNAANFDKSQCDGHPQA